jgi:hypothetical protein
MLGIAHPFHMGKPLGKPMTMVQGLVITFRFIGMNVVCTNVLSTIKGANMKNTVLDVLTAIALGLILCIGLLAYFDVLVK